MGEINILPKSSAVYLVYDVANDGRAGHSTSWVTMCGGRGEEAHTYRGVLADWREILCLRSTEVTVL